MKVLLKWLITLLILPTLWACDGGGGNGGGSDAGGGEPPLGGILKEIVLELFPIAAKDAALAAQGVTAQKPSTLTLRIKAFGVYDSGEREDITEQVDWLSSDISLATFSTPGVLLITGAGPVNITARLKTISSVPVSIPRWLGDPVALTVLSANTTMKVGEEARLDADLVYRDEMRLSAQSIISWTSSHPDVVAVSADGNLKAKGDGQATVTGVAQGVTATVQVAVSLQEERLVGMRIEPSVIDIPLLGTQPVRVIGQFSDGSLSELTRFVSWQIEQPQVASLVPGPAVRGLIAGETRLLARLEGLTSAPARVSVRQAELVSLTLNVPSHTLPAGVETSIQIIGTYSDNTKAVLSEGVTITAAPQEGVTVLSPTSVRAERQGDVTLVARVGNLDSPPVIVNVTAAELRTLTITDTSPSLPLGASKVLNVIGGFSDGQVLQMTDQVTLSIDNPAILEGAAGSTVLAKSMGDATVTAFSGQVSSNSVRVSVTDAEIESIQIQGAPPPIPLGLTESLKAYAYYSDGSVTDISALALWELSDEGVYVAHLGQGQLQALRAGETRVRALFEGRASEAVTVSVTDAIVTSIVVTPPSASMAAGNTQAFTATGRYSDGTNKDITSQVLWSSNAPMVARFGASNVLTSSMPGDIEISASLGTSVTSQPVLVTVTAAQLADVQIDAPPMTLALGRSASLVVTGIYSDGTTADLTAQVPFWLIANPFVATVGPDGTVTTLGEGSTAVAARITVDGKEFIASTMINVTTAVLERIEAQTTAGLLSLSLPKGTSGQLHARAYYSDGSSVDTTFQSSWQSSDPSVAKALTTGLLAARGLGEASVRASFGGLISNSVQVTVSEATLQELTVTPAVATVPLGVAVQLQADGLFTDGTSSDITDDVEWESDNSGVVVAGPFGDMYPMMPGQATITARTREGLVNQAFITVTAAALESIQLTPSPVALPRGINRQITAVGNYTDGSTQDLTELVDWRSLDTDVATVNQRGLVTAINQGSTTLDATYGGISSTPVAVTVSDPVLEQIQITPDTSSLSVGLTRALTATGVYSDDSTVDLTNSVQWNSSSPTVAGVSGSGVVTARQQGAATISARFEFVTGSATVDVTAAQLTSIVVTGAPASLPSGYSAQLVATGNYTDGSTADISNQVAWSSSQSTILRVSSSGGVTGLAQGTASVHAALSGITSNDAFTTVTSAVLLTLAVSPDEITLPRGLTRSVAARGDYSDNQSADLTTSVSWQSQNPAVATVDSSGLIRGVSTGTAMIVASRDGITSNTVTVTVTEAQLSFISITPTSLVIPRGVANTLTATGTYTDGSTQNISAQVSWLPANATVATVSPTGVVTGANVGQTTVRASSGGVNSNTVTVQVTQAVLTSLSISPQPVAIAQGRTQQMTATGRYSDGSTQNLSSAVSWRSSNTSIFTVNSAGLVSGVFLGEGTLSATLGSVTGTAVIKVEKGPSIVSVSGGLSVGSAGLGCLTDGNTSDAYDSSCVTYSLNSVNFGWTPGSTQMTLATTFSVPLKSIRFTGYWRQAPAGALGSWAIFGCNTSACSTDSRVQLSPATPIGFGTRISFSDNTTVYPFYRAIFMAGPVNRNGGSGTANFSEVIYGF